MRVLLTLTAAVLALSVPALAGERPPQPAAQTDSACQWAWKSGGGVGLWTETCALETGVWTVDWNERETRFDLKLNGDMMTTVVQVFRKPADAPISAILPELKKRGSVPDTAECIFKPAEGASADKAGRALYEIRPTGARLAALEATPGDEVPEPPCGEYGWSTHGVRTFRLDPKHPGFVLYVNEGQDGTMIAPDTITFD